LALPKSVDSSNLSLNKAVIRWMSAYKDLAERINKHGFKESESSVASKISRATVPAAFFLVP
jgi:virulence-associated protein VapD